VNCSFDIVADPAVVLGNLSAGAWKGEDVSRNESEPVSASLIRQGKGQPPRNGEARCRPLSNERVRRSMFPGVRADGGRRKINQEPGRPGETVYDSWSPVPNGQREQITAGRPRRESEGFIVALKPPITVERRDPAKNRFCKKSGEPLGSSHYGRRVAVPRQAAGRTGGQVGCAAARESL